MTVTKFMIKLLRDDSFYRTIELLYYRTDFAVIPAVVSLRMWRGRRESRAYRSPVTSYKSRQLLGHRIWLFPRIIGELFPHAVDIIVLFAVELFIFFIPYRLRKLGVFL